jgi:hypothetical protein
MRNASTVIQSLHSAGPIVRNAVLGFLNANRPPCIPASIKSMLKGTQS